MRALPGRIAQTPRMQIGRAMTNLQDLEAKVPQLGFAGVCG